MINHYGDDILDKTEIKEQFERDFNAIFPYRDWTLEVREVTTIDDYNGVIFEVVLCQKAERRMVFEYIFSHYPLKTTVKYLKKIVKYKMKGSKHMYDYYKKGIK